MDPPFAPNASRKSATPGRSVSEVLSEKFSTFDHHAKVVSPYEDEAKRDAEFMGSAHTPSLNDLNAYMLTQPFPLFLQPGDIVAVNHGLYGRKEGLVVGSSVDYAVSPKQFAGVQIFVLTLPCHEGSPSC